MSVEVYGGGGGASLKLQSKIVTPSTEQQIVTPDSGIDGLSKVTVNPMPGGTMAAPTVSSSGLITSRIEAGGYLNTGDSRTLQMSTRAGKTIVPATTDQVAIPARTYATGQITVKGDGNLVPGNIRKGVSIFDVLGNFVGDGAYKVFFGRVYNNAVTAYLTIPTPGDFIAPNKIKAVVIWSQSVSIEQTPSALTLMWIYASFVSASEVYVVRDKVPGVETHTSNFVINPQSGCILAGWSSTDYYCFGNMPYHYIVVADV
nr:MAG TPA: tail protein [Caudoviricetes sp.]